MKVSELMYRSNAVKRNPEGGQGLVEYSIILALFALVVIAALAVIGPGVGNIFSESSKAFDTDIGEPAEDPVGETVGEITIGQAEYINGKAHIDVQYNNGSDPSVILTASPGGVMETLDHHYHIFFSLPGCPCQVTITSNTGSSTTVWVGE